MGYEISLLTIMGISVIGALSLNMILGFCGQISLGHAAFLGIGAYTSAMLTKAGVPFLLFLVLILLKCLWVLERLELETCLSKEKRIHHVLYLLMKLMQWVVIEVQALGEVMMKESKH